MHTEILHEGCLARLEIIGILPEWRPLRGAVITFVVFPPESRAILIGFEPEVFAIPRDQFFWVLRFEKHASNSGHAFFDCRFCSISRIFCYYFIDDYLCEFTMAFKCPARDVRRKDHVF